MPPSNVGSAHTTAIETLAETIGTPDAPALLDVRIDEDVALDPQILPAAIRHPFTDVAALAPDLQDVDVVVYCQKGKKISQGAAAILRDQGVRASYLAEGQWGWRDAGLPMVRIDKIPPRNAEGRTVWVTRERPKIDRIACPWLIRRFVDPDALVLYVDPIEVDGVAEKFNATPFDVDGVFFSHRGDHCSFDTMLEELGLKTETLSALSDIVRGADTARHDLAPEAAGLLAVSLGLSHMFADDLEQLEAGLTLYDALYRWARDGRGETHTWTGASAGPAV